MTNIKLQAKGEFPFTFYIEKAVSTESEGKLFVEGVASTTNIDHDNERMAPEALSSMCNIINSTGVPLRLEHSQDDKDVIGTVFKAWVDERNQLWIKAAIEASHAAGRMVHDSMKNGIAKFGLSVGGKVRNAVRELSESTGKMVRTFYDVMLDEVSVTSRPANYDSWLFAKSFKGKEDDVAPFYDSPLYTQFLFENKRLDYIYQFSKSIPYEAWKKSDDEVTINNNEKSMDPKDTKKEEVKDEATKAAEDTKEEATKAEEGDKDAEKAEDGVKEDTKKAEDDKEDGYVKSSDFTSFASTVTKTLSGIIKALSTNPKETTNPDTDKPEVQDNQTAKEMSVDAKDTANPDKSKEDESTQQTAKAEEGEKEETEKAADDEETEKGDFDAEAEAEKEVDGEEYEIKNIGDALKSITNLNKKLSGVKVTKSQKPTEGLSAIDTFAATVAATFDLMNEKIEKSGNRVLGSKQAFLDMIRNDEALQKSIKEMISEPGIKKSVVRGVPYMFTKSGQKFALTATPVDADKVEKSATPKTFKDLYKSEYGSFTESN